MIQEKMTQTSPQMFSKKVTFLENSIEGQKAYRTEEVLSQTMLIDNILFDIDENSMDRIDRVISLANWKYNQKISQGIGSIVAYTEIYSNTLIPWKTATNEIIQVSIEMLCKVQESALHNLSEIWVKYK